MSESETKYSNLRIWLSAEELLKAIQVFERLVDNRETNNRVDDIDVDIDFAEDACQ